MALALSALHFVLSPRLVSAQGFAGLGSTAEGYRVPDPTYRFQFPRDHGPHPGFRIEWWYLTANLTGDDGQQYGVQWTLFRSALAPELAPKQSPGQASAWNSTDLWMGHAAVTTPTSHHVAERFARGGIGQAGVKAHPYQAWIDDWAMTGFDAGHLSARGGDFSYDLRYTAMGPIVAQGAHGYSVKAFTGQASHYYSQPFYQIEGNLTLPGGSVAVSGQAWLDREWSSQPLAADQSGWDWVSLHFDDGAKMMGFQLRDTAAENFTVATWIAPDGTATAIAPGQLTATPLQTGRVAGRDVPVIWRWQLPEKDLDITLSAMNPQSWMATTVSYWEGPVEITGSHPGRGYLEMTGYVADAE